MIYLFKINGNISECKLKFTYGQTHYNRATRALVTVFSLFFARRNWDLLTNFFFPLPDSHLYWLMFDNWFMLTSYSVYTCFVPCAMTAGIRRIEIVAPVLWYKTLENVLKWPEKANVRSYYIILIKNLILHKLEK